MQQLSSVAAAAALPKMLQRDAGAVAYCAAVNASDLQYSMYYQHTGAP
jgi:hypothetical protein